MTTPKEFAKQLRRFAKFVGEQPDVDEWSSGWGYPALDLVDTLHAMWDNMLMQDCFGTEGQLDPRGDRRD